jgi:hypothetical protein
MQEQIKDAFKAITKGTGDRLRIQPELKVTRSGDTLYISELRKTTVSMMAVVEVVSSGKSDKAPMPLGALDAHTLQCILNRLKSM